MYEGQDRMGTDIGSDPIRSDRAGPDGIGSDRITLFCFFCVFCMLCVALCRCCVCGFFFYIVILAELVVSAVACSNTTSHLFPFWLSREFAHCHYRKPSWFHVFVLLCWSSFRFLSVRGYFVDFGGQAVCRVVPIHLWFPRCQPVAS